jgi:hypothetical protein
MRLAVGLAKFTPSFAGKNLSAIRDTTSCGIVADTIEREAKQESRNPTRLSLGGKPFREIKHVDRAGRTISEFRAPSISSRQWLRQRASGSSPSTIAAS